MQVGKWGNSLAVRLPAAVVEALQLKEGDEIEIEVAGDRTFKVARDRTKDEAIASLRSLARPMPPGWRLSRDGASERNRQRGAVLPQRVRLVRQGRST